MRMTTAMAMAVVALLGACAVVDVAATAVNVTTGVVSTAASGASTAVKAALPGDRK